MNFSSRTYERTFSVLKCMMACYKSTVDLVRKVMKDDLINF